MLSVARTQPFHKRDRVSVRCAPAWYNRPASVGADDRLAATRAASLGRSVLIDTLLDAIQGTDLHLGPVLEQRAHTHARPRRHAEFTLKFCLPARRKMSHPVIGKTVRFVRRIGK